MNKINKYLEVQSYNRAERGDVTKSRMEMQIPGDNKGGRKTGRKNKTTWNNNIPQYILLSTKEHAGKLPKLS